MFAVGSHLARLRRTRRLEQHTGQKEYRRIEFGLVEPRAPAPELRERQLFEQLAKLRREQERLRERAVAGEIDATRSERLRQIDVESTATWNGIRSARAEARAAYRARMAGPPLDPFRSLVERKRD